ncbi:MAG: hypothetical protein IT440_13750, partial [Phycisphaeraceae bacterium]|nr:hypothetical protein [Phycisphaeraceae bacterium]
MQVKIAADVYEYPSAELGELRDCNGILDDVDALHQRMDEDGYLLIRQLHDRETVLDAGMVLLGNLASQNGMMPGTPVSEAHINPEAKVTGFAGGRKGLSHHPNMLAMLEGKPIFTFFQRYFGEPAL